MVGDTVLGEIVCTNLFGAVTGANLRFPICGALSRFAFILLLLDAACEQKHGFLSVLQLAALRGASDVDSSRLVDDTYGSLNLVYVLTPCTTGTRGFNFKVRRIDFYLRTFVHGHDSDRRGRRVDAALFFRRRDSLHAMDACFVLQDAVYIDAFDFKLCFFVSALGTA